jgi:hypothetical protein
MAGYGAAAPEEEEPATMVQCPNCGVTLKIEVEPAEEIEAAPAPDAGPSVRDALMGAMGG